MSPSVRLLFLPVLPTTDAVTATGRNLLMEVLHARCAGLDISKKDAKVCVRIAAAGRRKPTETVTMWSSMTSQILALRDHLAAEQVTCVVMEATGDYWKPFYYLLEDLPGVEVMLVNARHVKSLPGRKTDVADATWLAQLGAHGLVRASFVPPDPIRQLRDLTRTRSAITRERSREIQRLEKLLEDAGIKLSSVATDIVGVSGRAMIEVLIAGDRDAARMADLAQKRLRNNIPATHRGNGRRFHHRLDPFSQLVDHRSVLIDEVEVEADEKRVVLVEPASPDMLSIPKPGDKVGILLDPSHSMTPEPPGAWSRVQRRRQCRVEDSTSCWSESTSAQPKRGVDWVRTPSV